MARNELTKGARDIADLIRYKARHSGANQKYLARLVGMSESQFSRTFQNNVEMVAMVIDALGIVLIDEDEIRSLKILARKALDTE